MTKHFLWTPMKLSPQRTNRFYSIIKPKHLSKFSNIIAFLLLLSSPLYISPVAYAEEIIEIVLQENLKISETAIASLKSQLSDEKFQLVEEKLLGQSYKNIYKQLSENTILFSTEEVKTIQNSINLYVDILAKIQHIAVAPSIKKIHAIKADIIKLNKSLTNLPTQEQDSVQKEIAQQEINLNKYVSSFKQMAHQFHLERIKVDKLPSMLNDLGYEDSFYEVIHRELLGYIRLIRKVNTQSSIMDSLAEVTKTILHTQKELKATSVKEEKAAIAEKLKTLVNRKNNLQHNFTLTATGIDSTLDKKSAQKINIEEEMSKIFSPLIIGLTEITEPSRRIEFLRGDILYHQQYLPKIQKGIEQINRSIQETQDKRVKAKLLKEKTYWVQQEKEISAQLAVAEQQLIDLLNRKLSPKDAFDQFVQSVFSERGLNIMFSLLIFFVSFSVLMLIRYLIMLINPFNYIPKLRFLGSLLDVTLYLLVFIVSILALLVSLYVAGEVLALAIVVVILLGMLWTLRNNLPLFSEQIKLLLGYGPVREGERVIHDGIPWLVESIGIYSYLKNALLTGGTLRLPIKDLINMRSRPYSEDETWFPCEEGDSVLINHKGWRKVIQITPQRITFEWYEMKETMLTSQFLSQKIFNLSKGPFWAGVNVYIAYKHRFELFDEIKKFEAFVEEEFKKTPLGKYLIAPWVDFSEMTDTSLGLMVWVQLTAEGAEKYNGTILNLNKICFRAANKYNWEIKRFHAIEQHQPNIPNEQVSQKENFL